MKGERIRVLRRGEEGEGPVLYWMSRDQRVDDNWALLFAQESALLRQSPLVVVFCLAPSFLQATGRHYRFMFSGLQDVERRLAGLNIPFVLIEGEPVKAMCAFAEMHKVRLVVTDFDPLRIKRQWKKSVCDAVGFPVYEVDAHNVVPCWEASSKQEYGAYTLRPKLRRLLPAYLDGFPPMTTHPFSWGADETPPDWEEVEQLLWTDRAKSRVDWLVAGERAASEALNRFLDRPIALYLMRNDPNRHAQSDLSPYLHFGHLSAQRIVLEMEKSTVPKEGRDAFLEELIVRRELADNFCYYNESYDSYEGFPEWARKTLDKHRDDPRDYVYDLDVLEMGHTHDNLWNAAQREMVARGKMAGYLRMYWAKKILEWSPSPEDALERAIYLNNRYELDGRDPNGYAGIAWAIGGVHDRPWGERPIFGTIRFMTERGCRSKFDVDAYIRSVGDGMLGLPDHHLRPRNET